MSTNNSARPRDRDELVLRPMTPPLSDYHALLARALARCIELGLPLAVPFPRSSRGVTVELWLGHTGPPALDRLSGTGEGQFLLLSRSDRDGIHDFRAV